MRSLGPPAWLVVAALAGCVQAEAQTIYRCGPQGREYTQTPCKDGRAIDAADERSPAQRAAARRVARATALEAEQLRRERLAREAESARQGAAGFRTAPRPEPPASAPGARSGKGNKAARATKRRPAASAARS